MNDRLIVNADTAKQLIENYGSPLYVYDETIFRTRAREMKQFMDNLHGRVCYSAKANSNLVLLSILKEEGYRVDAMSPGEIALDLKAGFEPADITFYSNNISKQEMMVALENGIELCVDSLDQLDLYGSLAPHTSVGVRINPGIGTGHHEKVVTGGKTKFGISLEEIPQIFSLAKTYDLQISGLCMHVGSLFLDPEVYLKAMDILFTHALSFPHLTYMDLGGGFGVPYQSEDRLDLTAMNQEMQKRIEQFDRAYGTPIEFRIEPGRYIVSECCELLGTVTAKKENAGTVYVGCDIGFNVLMRPVLYDSYHEIVGYSEEKKTERVDVVGNICESGDILAKDRILPIMKRGDYLGVCNAGAYGYSMASNYNGRLRPAEVLLTPKGITLIRRRETIETLLQQL